MQARIVAFIESLRNAGLPATLAESLDAMRAVSVVGVERSPLREGLAATLVKDEADRPLFDALFDRFFALPGRHASKRARSQPTGEGEGRGPGQGATPSPREPRREPPQSAHVPQHASDRQRAAVHSDEPHTETGHRLDHKRALQNVPFRDMPPQQVEECAALLAELAQRFRAHLRRRRRTAPRGRLDIRRTLRRSISSGGVPIEPALRRRRPGRPDLIALCDYSHSVVTASNFLLALLTPAQEFFRRVRLFAFVDVPVEVSIEHGVLVPHDRLDLYARSDFGRVLVSFWERYNALLTRSTILLILGDARNNRRPPRADVLGRMQRTARQVIWLNPDPRTRWNTGDSVMHAYQPHCDTLLAASTVRELHAALRGVFRSC